MSTLGSLFGRGTNASKPAAGTAGALYYATDVPAGMVRDNGSSWDLVDPFGKINESVLVAPAASVTFSSIPATYRHLRLEILGRIDTAATNFGNVYVQFNGDSGSNYITIQGYAHNATFGGGGAVGTSMQIGYAPAASATTSMAGGTSVTIYDYARTAWFKTVNAQGMIIYDSSGADFFSVFGSGMWKNTAAITSITVLTDAGKNFLTDTVISLYGLF